jgi:uncharacterized protein YcbK (DUF882 family)
MNRKIETFYLNIDGEKNIAKNFKVGEFRSKCGSHIIKIDTEFVKNFLQKIREHFKRAVTVISAYRTEAHNAKVGGGKNSFHLYGEAFDIKIIGIPLIEIARYAENIGVKGIIIYNNFVHLDARNSKYFARNNNGKISTVTKWN